MDPEVGQVSFKYGVRVINLIDVLVCSSFLWVLGLYVKLKLVDMKYFMMTSSNGNIFRVTGDWWIPHTKVSDA